MTKERLQSLFDVMDTLSVGVLGDFCLDIYWDADMTKSQLSRETPHYTLPVVEERISLGGAGNVAKNVASLRPKTLYTIGVIGNGWRSALMNQLIRKINADSSGLVADPSRFTNAYIKSLRHGLSETVYEEPRLDFESYAPLAADIEQALLHSLDRIAPRLDVLCVCDQLSFGCVTKAVRERLSELSKNGLTVIVDSRDRIVQFENVIVKPNDMEACRGFGIPAGAPRREIEKLALSLSQKNRSAAIITMGSDGCVVADHQTTAHVPAVSVSPPIDICGAGDTFLSALACALAAGASPVEAAELANLASSLTIRQLCTTGVTNREALLRELVS